MPTDVLIMPAPPALESEAANGELHILAGEVAAGRGQPGIAAREFLKALEYVEDRDLAERATALAAMARDDALAEATARRWLQIEPNAMDAREVIARTALRRGDLAEAAAQCKQMIDGHPGGEDEGFRHVSLLLSQLPESVGSAAVSVMQQLLDQYPRQPAAHHALGMVALRFERLDVAEQAARRAQELEPKNREHSLLLVGVLIRQHKLDQSEALIEKMLKDDAKSTELRMGYARLLLEADQREAARVQLQKVLRAKPDYTDAHFALGVLAYNDQDYEAAEKYLSPLLNSERSRDAAFQLGRIEEARKRYDKALDYYGRVTTGMQSLDATVRRAGVLGRMGRVEEGRQLIAQMRDQFPQLSVRFYLAEGEMLLGVERSADALALYDDALKRSPGEADLLYGRSLAYEKLGRVDAAERDLRAIIAENPNDARALNALGYMLAVHTSRLPEASKLVGRALELEPDDAAIIDSMGWVQYKLGKPAEARDLLQKAYDRFPDPEVAAHLGEVMWSMGDRDAARAVWDKGLKADPDHAVLKETIERLSK